MQAEFYCGCQVRILHLHSHCNKISIMMYSQLTNSLKRSRHDLYHRESIEYFDEALQIYRINGVQEDNPLVLQVIHNMSKANMLEEERLR